MPKKKSEHYVNNKELLEAMIVYRTKVEKSYMKTFNKDLTEFPKQERGKRWEGKPRIPNYLGECIEWLGWAIMTWSFSGFVFALWTTFNLLPRALKHHSWYKEKFNDYPKERKAIIPKIL